jgi:hypothetical protein
LTEGKNKKRREDGDERERAEVLLLLFFSRSFLLFFFFCRRRRPGLALYSIGIIPRYCRPPSPTITSFLFCFFRKTIPLTKTAREERRKKSELNFVSLSPPFSSPPLLSSFPAAC